MDIRVILILIIEACIVYYGLLRAELMKSYRACAAVAVLLFGALAIRYFQLPYETLDYQNFLSGWVNYYRNHGGFSALKDSLGNYNIPYLYFLALFSYSDIYDLYLIKLLSIATDLLAAYAAAMLLGKLRPGEVRQLACFFVVLFLPTVILNGSLWGQCDSVYTAFAILGIYLALDDKPVASMVAIAVSFGFKLQAVFIMPVYAVLWMNGKFKWYHFLVFPLTYVLLVLPAVLAGRPFLDTITLYLNQTGSIGDGLNYNSSSVFAIFTNVQNKELASRIAVIAAFAYMLLVLGCCLVFRKRLTGPSVLAAAVLLCVGIPFLLPHMHDRYFFVADCLTVVFAFTLPEGIFAAPLTQYASYLGYYAYLHMRFLKPMRYGAAAFIVVLALGAVALTRTLCYPSGSPLPAGGTSRSPAARKKRKK